MELEQGNVNVGMRSNAKFRVHGDFTWRERMDHIVWDLKV